MSSIFGLRSSYMLEYCWLFTLLLRSGISLALRGSGLRSHLSRRHLRSKSWKPSLAAWDGWESHPSEWMSLMQPRGGALFMASTSVPGSVSVPGEMSPLMSEFLCGFYIPLHNSHLLGDLFGVSVSYSPSFSHVFSTPRALVSTSQLPLTSLSSSRKSEVFMSKSERLGSSLF